jgi:hypothetical protein
MKYILYNKYLSKEENDYYFDYFISFHKEKPVFLYKFVGCAVSLNYLLEIGITIDNKFYNFLNKNDFIIEDEKILDCELFIPETMINHKICLNHKIKNILKR